ncbi:plasmid replication protein RepC_soli-1a (plasmid) [Phaeobacter piscinae]|uniref:Plasmid replication protein RepC_soli-1a n=1 Tax=Phaeobacter piscinae TaxID=1580596 RepID=A0ABN5DVU7_9RHOB|nr:MULTISPECIES: replication initiation protein RepC [Phaeobacter]ATG38078.1 plasmid replication protein RepC_soli-1a [Phaeobacter piscinae]AUQ88599.1 plasmid replication protein RepC_soli-1a [Phaeobacter piscinae]AUQ92588.1 plasmid replication protein RepC_soli-1a [Phaeobacter inhibens]AUR26404.1 plasmid replication protein RepC_soli-1a [Phaeobacter piscinae]
MNNTYYPVLPQGWERSQVEQLLVEIAPAIGLRAKRLNALIYMMMHTRPADWTASDAEPVYFAPQTDTALALGKTERALRSDENALEAVHGMIEKRVKANGARSFYGKCGIVFSRLIDLIPDLIELRERIRADRARVRELVQLRSTYLRHMKRRIEAASPQLERTTDFWAAIQAFEQWPHSSKLRSMSLDALEAHVDACRALCGQIDDLIENSPDSSSQAEENFRSFIQEDTYETNPVKCNAGIHKRTSGKPSDTNLTNDGPNGPAKCKENEDEAAAEAFKSKFMRGLTPQRLFELAGADMRLHVSNRQGDRAQVRELDLIEAAHDMLPHLGINYSAWAEAAQLMGTEGAALCVLILDANRDHPSAPVKNPGGMLRAMTRRYQTGKLNLVGSLIGLSRRRGL